MKVLNLSTLKTGISKLTASVSELVQVRYESSPAITLLKQMKDLQEDNTLSPASKLHKQVELQEQVDSVLSNKQKLITRRDIEQRVSPSFFNGDTHDVVSARLKKEPKTVHGVLGKVECLSSVMNGLSGIADALNQIENHKLNVERVISGIDSYVGIGNWYGGLFVCEKLGELIEAFREELEKEGDARLTVVGATTPYKYVDFGVEYFNINFTLVFGEWTLKIENLRRVYSPADGYDHEEDPSTKVTVNDVDWVEFSKTLLGDEDSESDVKAEMEEFLLELKRSIVSGATCDCYQPNLDWIRPETMQMLIEDLSK